MRGPRPSFALAGAFLCALATSCSEHYLWAWAALALMAWLASRPLSRPLPRSPVTAALAAYLLVLVANQFLVSPAYAAIAGYLTAILALGFYLGSCLGPRDLRALFVIGCALMGLLSLWGLVQYTTGFGYLVTQPGRANAIFNTPNTFAAALNLFLLPLAVLWLAGVRDRRVPALALLLFAGLLASGSRGGLLGLAGGALLVTLLFPGSLRARAPARARSLAAGLLWVVLLFQLGALAGIGNPRTSVLARLLEPTGQELQQANAKGTDRLALYAIAWDAILERPWTGYGYFTFGHLYQGSERPLVPDSHTHFVHNDYLQTWVELGLAGLLALLALWLALARGLRRAWRGGGRGRRTWALAIGGALASFAVHGLVDFPLYPLPLVLLFATLAGAANRVGHAPPRAQPIAAAPAWSGRGHGAPSPWRSPAQLALALLLVWQLHPVAARVASDHALDRLRQFDLAGAQQAYALARGLAPYEGFYYWAAGRIWRDQAEATGSLEAAGRADDLFARGAALHPYETRNLLARVALHREFPGLATDPATLTRWMRELMRRAPQRLDVNLEYARVLGHLGRGREARRHLALLARRHVQNDTARRLLADVRAGLPG